MTHPQRSETAGATWARSWLALALALAACTTDATLVVQVRTDLSPSVEFDRITVAGTGLDATFAASDGAGWGRGIRVAELGPVPTGSYTFEVRALLDDAEVVARPVRVDLDGGVRVVTVLLTRDCAGVSCPDGGDPSAIACLGGRCVVEGCTEERPERCASPECVADGDCAPLSACAPAECAASGTCIAVPDDALCRRGESCLGEVGCAPDASACFDFDRLVASTGDSDPPSLVANGDELLVAWNGPSAGLHATRTDLVGMPIADAQISFAGYGQVTASTDVTPVVAAREGDALYVWTLTAMGTRDTAVGIAATMTSWWNTMDLAWTGERLGVVWEDERSASGDVFFAISDLTPSGIDATAQVSNTPESSRNPAIAWTGTDYMVAWEEHGDAPTNIHVARLDPTGALTGAPTTLTTSLPSTAPSIAWGDAGLGVAYVETGMAGQVLFLVVDRDGRVRVLPLPIGPLRSDSPSIAYSGSQWGVAWREAAVLGFARIDGATGDLVEPPRSYPALEVIGAPSLIHHRGSWYVARLAAPTGCCDVRIARICD